MEQFRRFTLGIFLLVLVLTAATACNAGSPTATPTSAASLQATATPAQIVPTATPPALDEPSLLELKAALAEAATTQDRLGLQRTASFVKWVGAIYREGGTPPLDPPRGLTLTLNFLKENEVEFDTERPTYEPTWSEPAGHTSMFTRVTPPDGDPYYAHFYMQREPSAWRFVGIMTRIPYYDAPSVAQLMADPAAYEGKEFMYVGEYAPASSPPQGAGAPPESASFAIETFAGPLWVVMSTESYVTQLSDDADSKAGQPIRVFGTVNVADGVPFLVSDSAEFVEPGMWAEVGGVVQSIDADARNVTIQPEGEGAAMLHLPMLAFVSLPDGTRGSFEDIEVGKTVNATGVPQKDGTLLVEELFIAP